MDSKIEGKKRTKNANSQNNSNPNILNSVDSLDSRNQNEFTSASLGELLFTHVNNGDIDALQELFDECNKKSQTTLLLQTLLTMSYPNTERLFDFEPQYQNEAEELLGPSVAHLNAIQIACIMEDEDMSLLILEFVSKATLEMNAKKVLYEFMGSTWGNGNTLLHLASFLCMADLVRRLLELGANVNRRNERKYKPVDCTNDYNVMDIFLTVTEIKETNVVLESLSSSESISSTVENTQANQIKLNDDEIAQLEKEKEKEKIAEKEKEQNSIEASIDVVQENNEPTKYVETSEKVEEISPVRKDSSKSDTSSKKTKSTNEVNQLYENGISRVVGKSALKTSGSSKKKGRGVCFDALTSFLYMCQYGDPTEESSLPTVRKYLGLPLENGEENNTEIPEVFKNQIPISKEVLSNLFTAHNFLTPLHIAATYNQLGIVKLLVEHADAPINIQDVEGWTPLHCACAEGNFDVVEYLGRCTKRKYYEKAMNDKPIDEEEEDEENDEKYKGYTNDYHIFEYTEKNPILMRKPSIKPQEEEESDDDDDDDDDDEEEEEEEEECENDVERYAEICDDYETITDEIYGLLLKECNKVKDTNPDKPSIYAVDGPLLFDILNEDGNNAYEVCQDDPAGKLIQMHLKILINQQQELVKLAISKKGAISKESSASIHSDKKNTSVRSKLSEVIYTTTLNDIDEYNKEEEPVKPVEEKIIEKENVEEKVEIVDNKVEEEKEEEEEEKKKETIEEKEEVKIEEKEKSSEKVPEITISKEEKEPEKPVEKEDNSKTQPQIPAISKSNRNNLLLEATINSYEKVNSGSNNDVSDIKPSKSKLEKRLSESLDNLKFDSKNETTHEKSRFRPFSLILSRGFGGSDMALNSKGNKKFIPSFNLSLTEGGIKPFGRSHNRNNASTAGNGLLLLPTANNPSPSQMEANMGKIYRRSVQTYGQSSPNDNKDLDSSESKDKKANAKSGKILNNISNLNNENNNIKNTSTNSLREEVSEDEEDKTHKGKLKGSRENLKEDYKKSTESLKSDKSDKSSKISNRISTNVRKMFFLSFKSKKSNPEPEENQEIQSDILVNTMKKHNEKSSSKAQK